jgi:hemoglobin/transferrin/lactoferrin receptor protein
MQRKHILSILCAFAIGNTYAQKDTLQSITLNEFVYAANKFKENKRNIAQQIQLLNKKEIEWGMPQTTASMLEQNGNVFIQRSQAGGGSAVLRGFEANRIIMVVDGVRMNNAIYRAGHLQNVITIDNNILDNTEIMYGPASTLYGSDALGGVILFNTQKPMLSATQHTRFDANVMTRYSSATNEGTGHLHFNIGFKKLAFLTSVTYSKFGDVRQGSQSNPFYGDFGLRKQYVQRINGGDSIVNNDNPFVQKNSGYQQVDLLEKILFQQNKHISHNLNLQFSNSSNIPRYDRLTDVKGGKLRYAEWYYGPQQRALISYGLNASNLHGFVNEIKAGINYQAIEESRFQRNLGSNSLQGRVENVDVVGYNVDFRKMIKLHEITFGTDGQFNKVRSNANTVDIVKSTTTPLDTRYPDGGSQMFYGALYAQHIFKIAKDKLILNDGLRLNYISLNSKFNDTTFFPFPFKTATQNNTAVSGNLGVVYMPLNRWRFSLNGSTGFRAPNVDDMAKVFESAGGTALFVPNPNLKPEYTYNLDLGINYIVNNSLKIEGTGFYTWFKDAIIADKFTLNGQDSVFYNGKQTAVMANQNKAKAYIYGFNAAITANLSNNVTLYSTITFTYGRYTNTAGLEVPLDHVPPVFGKTSLMYHQKAFTTEVYAMYNGWKRIQDYSPSGEDNLTYATPSGMPSWYTLNLRAGYKLNSNMGIQIALENIMDQNYRQFASGISAPGRNFVITLRGNL